MANSTRGLDLLVIGGGIAGLTFAIDAHFSGHKVRIFEKRSGLSDFGDVLAMQGSCTRPLKRWPGFWDRLQKLRITTRPDVYKYDGSKQVATFSDPEAFEKESVAVHRNELHQLLQEYVEELGLVIEFGKNIIKYTETEDKGRVVLEDGLQAEADLVVAADGVGSPSWNLVLKEKVHATSSGFAVYRGGYPTNHGLSNPAIKKFCDSYGGDGFVAMFIGPNAHMVISKSDSKIGWLLTHKDEKGAIEDWNNIVPSDEALPWIAGWDNFLSEIIKTSPPMSVTDWKLMWRDPQPLWVSPLGRVVQIGDAAHSFLPTSAYGASMAMEDAHSLCASITRGAKENIPLSVRIHNALRFERVACAQKVGFKNREIFHKTDWEAVSKDPKALFRQWAPWLFNHDPEAYVAQKYDECAEYILNGKPFKTENAVPGHTFKAWTVKEFMEASESGKIPDDDGEWF